MNTTTATARPGVRAHRARQRPRLPAAALAWRAAGCAATLGLLVSLLLFAPARWLALAVARSSDGRLQLVHASGTIWRGQADVLLTGGPGSREAASLPQGLQWHIRPGWAAQPVLRLQLLAPCCMTTPLSGQLQAGWGSLRSIWLAHQSQWPTQPLAGLGTPWNTLRLEGELRLTTPGMELSWVQGRPALAGQLQADALGLASQLSTLRPLGSYRLTLQAGEQAAPARLQLTTLEGALRLTGDGQWVGGRLRFNGEAEAREGAEAALSNLLNIVGRRSGPRSRIAIG